MAAGDGAKTGEFDSSFDQRSPLSALDVQRARYGLASAPGNVYDISAEQFSVFVPNGYDGSPGWGLLVWSHPGNGGGAPREWADLLAKKKLIWIAARGAGNRRAVGVRVGLAIDAVHNLRQRYAIEE